MLLSPSQHHPVTHKHIQTKRTLLQFTYLLIVPLPPPPPPFLQLNEDYARHLKEVMGYTVYTEVTELILGLEQSHLLELNSV